MDNLVKCKPSVAGLIPAGIAGLETASYKDISLFPSSSTYDFIEARLVRSVAYVYIPLLSNKILIHSLGPGYDVIKPIQVSVKQKDDAFIASFEEANAHVAGDTWDEAVADLKYYLMDLLDSLMSHAPQRLGPGPRRQLAVLQSFFRPTEDAEQRPCEQDC